LYPVVLARLAALKNDGRAALATLPSKLKVARCTRTGGPSYLSLGQRKTRAECSIEELLVLKLTRFRGHRRICVEGVRDAKQGKEASTIPA